MLSAVPQFVVLVSFVAGLPDDCETPDACANRCPAELSCENDEECGEGWECVADCLPGHCVCHPIAWFWQCDNACLGRCQRKWTGPPRYVITNLGTLGGFSSVGLGLNDCGQVVGGSDNASGTRRAFLWERGQMIELGTLPGLALSEAWDINNHGVVVGAANYSWAGLSDYAFLWSIEAGIRALADLGGGESNALAINDNGQVVGNSTYSQSTTRHPYLWKNEEIIDLLTTYGGNSGVAWDINELGQIVGVGTMWDADGTVIELPTLGGDWTWAIAINNLGHVVGQSEPSPGSATAKAFIWDGVSMTDIAAVGQFSGSSDAWGINDAGQVAGRAAYYNPVGILEAGVFIYESATGVIRRPGELLAPGQGWQRLFPRAMNNRGQIAGQGLPPRSGGQRAFLMTPLTGDFDDDEDSDLEDFRAFRGCFSGPGAAVSAECEAFDIDFNGRIDLTDFQMLQWVLGA
jgi:probable HAF family extracellular repeat protein